MNDPPRLRDVGMHVKLGQDFFLDEEVPRHESEKGFVSGTAKSLTWRLEGSTILTFQELTTNKSRGRG